jgi:hypothetical protein
MDQKSLIPHPDMTSYEFPAYPKPNTGNLDENVDLAFMRIMSPSFPIWVEKVKVCLHQHMTYGCVKINVWDFGSDEGNIPVNIVGLGTSKFNAAVQSNINLPTLDNLQWSGNLQRPPYDIIIFCMTDECEGPYYDFVPGGQPDAVCKANFYAKLLLFQNIADTLKEIGIRLMVVPLHPPGHSPYIAHPSFNGDPDIYAADGWGVAEDGNRISRPPSFNELRNIYNAVVQGTRPPPYIALMVDNSGSMVPADMEPGLSQFRKWLQAKGTNFTYDPTMGEDWLRAAALYLQALDQDVLKNLVYSELEEDAFPLIYDQQWQPMDPSCLVDGCSFTISSDRGNIIIPGVKPFEDNIPLTVFPDLSIPSKNIIRSLISNLISQSFQINF